MRDAAFIDFIRHQKRQKFDLARGRFLDWLRLERQAPTIDLAPERGPLRTTEFYDLRSPTLQAEARLLSHHFTPYHP